MWVLVRSAEPGRLLRSRPARLTVPVGRKHLRPGPAPPLSHDVEITLITIFIPYLMF